jgi:hypothetical protein
MSAPTNNLANFPAHVNHPWPMLDRTIDSLLLNLRRNLIRTGGNGLAHVETLLGVQSRHLVGRIENESIWL